MRAPLTLTHNSKHNLINILFIGRRRLFSKLQAPILSFLGSDDHIVQVIVGETILSSVLLLDLSFQIVENIERLNNGRHVSDVEM